MKIAVYKNNYRRRIRGPNPTSVALRRKPVGELEIQTIKDSFLSMSTEELKEIKKRAYQKFGGGIWRLRILEARKWE